MWRVTLTAEQRAMLGALRELGPMTTDAIARSMPLGALADLGDLMWHRLADLVGGNTGKFKITDAGLAALIGGAT
jgi:hypothetical protein